MSGTYKGLNQGQINKRIREGRGQGHGPDYKPFIYTRDVSSLGRSHRIYGNKCRRLHHLLSDLELAVLLTLDWSPHVKDIREQFPLCVEDTVRLAQEHGISHSKFQGVAQVLSSDFLVDFDDPSRPNIAIQAKYSTDLAKPEVIERLELERRYWAEKDIPWFIVTEMDFAKVAFNNIQWFYPAQIEAAVVTDDLERYLRLFAQEFIRTPDKLITEVAQRLDVTYELEPGQALYWLRQLLARRYFIFDISTPYRTLKGKQLTLNDDWQGVTQAYATG
ncbi:TnsA endonuclease N-terminal domain-containing protein [Shewanella algae]|uniref:TnsA endonuclease N-terminal domain-containing protein n=1 Tax=bacterium 19NY03SH02 TaxID=2920631 RepID=A0AAU6V786_UNCXX|nr:TnsA endonuclease N-terminal domain-containing protein [Shewanella algae]MCT8982464.1 TnsA endonuclease N-terminal domain-containing protein [Shewanella algae]